MGYRDTPEWIKGIGMFTVIIVMISIGAFVVLSTIHITFLVWGPLP